ncbi:hypothetical protein J6590_096986 [Homalodisca vitripennis]|nr:hypothetical protein J6590_096986 [Homalodisca vitripennis]
MQLHKIKTALIGTISNYLCALFRTRHGSQDQNLSNSSNKGKILGSRHRHANDTNLHEKVSLAVFFNRRLGRGLLTCMKNSYENRLRKSVTFTASSRDLKVKPMSYNSAVRANRWGRNWAVQHLPVQNLPVHHLPVHYHLPVQKICNIQGRHRDHAKCRVNDFAEAPCKISNL